MEKKFNIPFSPPDITEEEIEAVAEVMRSGWITTGPKTKEFEQKIAEYVGLPKAVCLCSGTAGLELTLRILGIGPGDEVVTSAYTYTASASVIHHVGAKIVLVDTAPDSFEMDYQKLADAITTKTKVIIPVDLGGVMCDYDSIYKVVDNKKHLFQPSNEFQKLFNRIIVIADAAHAFGATQNNKNCGQVADFTSFSFHAVKNLTTAEGGAVVWKDLNEYNEPSLNNDWLYNQYMLYSLHGQSKDALSKSDKGSWEYDIVHLGYKANMTDITAAIGLIQLKRYPLLLSKRKQLIKLYDEQLHPAGIQTIRHFNEQHNSSGHLYLTRVPYIHEEKRNNIIQQMAEQGISTNVHYKPLPMHSGYKQLGFNIQDYPNAYAQFENEITMPLNTTMDEYSVQNISDTLLHTQNRFSVH